MLHHVSLPVSDLRAATALYSAALGALGYQLVAKDEGFAGYGLRSGEDIFALVARPLAKAASAGFHLAFAAPSRRAVDAFHAAALAHGAQENGAPGLRPQYGPGYYACFVLDGDGHHLEAVCKGE